MKKILIATDGSPASQEAVEFGVELAAEQDGAVVFVHVVPLTDRVPMSAFGMIGAVSHEPSEYDREALEEQAPEYGLRLRGLTPRACRQASKRACAVRTLRWRVRRRNDLLSDGRGHYLAYTGNATCRLAGNSTTFVD
jgi:nucleotide-binding universal stress UspA family protein